MGAVAGPEESITVPLLTKRLDEAYTRFKHITSIDQESEINEINQCALDVLSHDLRTLSESEKTSSKKAFEAIKARAHQLYMSSELMPVFLTNYDWLLAGIELMQRQLQEKPEDRETLERLTKSLQTYEEMTDKLITSPVVGLSQHFAHEIMEIRNKISEGKREVAQLIQAHRLHVYEEERERLPADQRDFEAFYRGLEKNTEQWLAAEPPLVRKEVVSGPRAKKKETECCEEIVDALLNHPDQVTIVERVEHEMKFTEGKLQEVDVTNYYVRFKHRERDPETGRETITDTEYKLTDLISGADFSQIHLDPSQVEAFLLMPHTFKPLLSDADLLARINDPHLDPPLTKEEKEALLHLSPGERFAIYMYTESGPDAMVNFLTRNLPEVMFRRLEQHGKWAQTPEQRIAYIKEAFIHSAILHSSLAKLPDYQPQHQQYLYRLEENLPQHILEQRVRLVKENEVSCEAGIFSAAHTKPAENFWIQGANAAVFLRNTRGKNITLLSAYKENEVVLPSVQIQWRGMRTILYEPWGKEVTVFLGEPVNQPQEAPASKAQYISLESYTHSG